MNIGYWNLVIVWNLPARHSLREGEAGGEFGNWNLKSEDINFLQNISGQFNIALANAILYKEALERIAR